MAMTVRVLKAAGYSRVAIDACIATMLPKSAMAELDQAADEQGLYRSALTRIVLMRYLEERASTASDKG